MKIYQLVSNMYYIRLGGYGGPSLWRANYNNGPISTQQELVEGVENMQVLYGQDTTGDGLANQYMTMDNVTNISAIVSVRISLLMRSIDPVKVIAATATKTINDIAVTSQSDRNIRFVVSSTFKFRNRGVM